MKLDRIARQEAALEKIRLLAQVREREQIFADQISKLAQNQTELNKLVSTEKNLLNRI
jgi:hypothetical protein